MLSRSGYMQCKGAWGSHWSGSMNTYSYTAHNHATHDNTPTINDVITPMGIAHAASMRSRITPQMNKEAKGVDT